MLWTMLRPERSQGKFAYTVQILRKIFIKNCLPGAAQRDIWGNFSENREFRDFWHNFPEYPPFTANFPKFISLNYYSYYYAPRKMGPI